MGVIQIRQRSERLGNIGGVRPVDTDSGAVRALAAITAATRERAAADAAAVNNVAGGLAKAVPAGIKAYADFRERQDQEAADRYVARYQQGMDAYNNGSTDAAGNRVKGAMEADFDDSGLWLEDNVDYRDKFGAKLAKELKMSDRALEIARKRLVSYDLHTQNRWQGRAAQVDDARARAAANENFNAQRATALDVLVDGNSAGGEPVKLALNDYSDALEHALDAAHVPEEARPEIRRKAALQFCQDAFARKLRHCDEAALSSDEATPEYVKRMYVDLESELKANGWEGVFGWGEVQTKFGEEPLEGGDGGDVLRAHLKGADMEAFKAAALKDLGAARARSLHAVDARRREERLAVGRTITEKELAIRDVPEELWADSYEKLGRDKTLLKTDPARAMRFLDTAREMREATAKAKANAVKAAAKAKDDTAKAEIKANEDGLAGALCQLQVLELEGSLPQDAANEAQAALWRKFRVCALGHTVSPGFMHTFMGRMQTRLSDQEANAMRKFYRAFGYRGEVNEYGEIPASDRKSDTSDYAAPRNPGDRHSENYFRIPAADLFIYGDSLLRTLRALGPDMNREGVVEKEISRLKTDWVKGKLDKNREATVRNVMDIQREARTRWEMAHPDKRREDDDGRRNGSTSK